MRCQVVTVTSRIPDRAREPYYRWPTFLASLARFGIVPGEHHDNLVVLGMHEPWWGLMTKPRRLRHWLRGNGCSTDYLIVSDSYDVIFLAHPRDVAEKFVSLNKTNGGQVGGRNDVLFNCEKTLFPRADLSHCFLVQTSPWKYLNSGLFIGKPDVILAMLDRMNLDDIADDYRSPDIFHGGGGIMVNTNDQGWYQYAFAAQPVPMTLDVSCNLFQTLSGCELSEFQIGNRGFVNLTTGTSPMVIHGNGDGKNRLIPEFLRLLELPG
jgi:hypothetical protein